MEELGSGSGALQCTAISCGVYIGAAATEHPLRIQGACLYLMGDLKGVKSLEINDKRRAGGS
jgi:hypothetical protein